MVAYSKFTKAELIEKLEQLTTIVNDEKYVQSVQMIHDLDVHRVELEAQNQELREVHKQLEITLDRYADLYDFAPVGYVTLGKDGVIQGINLTGASLIGRERSQLLGRSLSSFLAKESIPVFVRHMQQVCHSPVNLTDELVIKTGRGQMIEVNITSVLNHYANSEVTCRSVLIDITERKQYEQNMRRSRQLLRELSTHHEAVREEERKRVAREIHDELGQSLLALKMDVSMLSAALHDASPALRGKTQAMLDLINRTVKSVRDISSNLRPAVLDLGLVPALEWLLEEFRNHTDIPCKLKAREEDVQVSDEIATGVFRIVQESLTNVARHAHATKVDVSLTANTNVLTVKIKDNGIGIDVGSRLSKKNSFGLTGIGERISMMGGQFNIEGETGKGTTLLVTVPYFKDVVKS